MQTYINISSVKELGRYICRVRKAAGLTQVDAASLCGVSIPFFNAVENGKGSAQADKVLHVCHQLGVKVMIELPEVG